MIPLSNDVIWFIVGGLVDVLISRVLSSTFQKNFAAASSALPSNSEAERNTACDKKGMMPDFCYSVADESACDQHERRKHPARYDAFDGCGHIRFSAFGATALIINRFIAGTVDSHPYLPSSEPNISEKFSQEAAMRLGIDFIPPRRALLWRRRSVS